MPPRKTRQNSKTAQEDPEEPKDEELEATTRRSKRTKPDVEEKEEQPTRGKPRTKNEKKAPATKKLPVKEVAVEGGDSDDDAPEEVSLSVAKQQAQAVSKAEVEGRKALDEKRKAANRAKEAAIAKSREQAASRSLPADILNAVVAEEGSRKEREGETERERMIKEQNRTKIVKLPGEKKLMKKQGFMLQKLTSSHLPAANISKSTSSEALEMLSTHFGGIRRQEYTSVYDRRKRPAALFAQKR